MPHKMNKRDMIRALRNVICEMLAGQNPFDAENQKSTFKNIKDKKAVFSKHFLQEALDVLTSFLAKKSNNRFGAGRYARSEVTTHPFFRNIDWDKAEAKEGEPPIVPKIVSAEFKV
ncbi:protein kinase C, eye isozyme-like [Bactrocera dorsalis]|uniref:Protein kinase C, eye isozyme-like n=1 Tax=Bactrocera dorsalis TaxID=27457 RepID=A0A8N4L4C1_BACDO|nr:protein kinase C, eye isozyme-like [Bactrocera dorsalis]